MHDGKTKTPKEAVEFKAHLLAFLKSLEGERWQNIRGPARFPE